jgi:rhamnogalacturonyl hydrolase YesR
MNPDHSSYFTRRRCLQTLGGLSLLGFVSRASSLAAPSASPVRHLVLPVGAAPELPLPEKLVTGFGRFGWKTFAVGQEPVLLQGLEGTTPAIADSASCRLRLTVALDVRDAHAIEVTAPNGQPIGTLEVRFAALFQVQEMPLTPVQARAILKQGAVLKMVSGNRPVWFFAPSPEAKPGIDPVQLPHVLIATGGDPAAQFEERLRGLVMLQGFGWQSGCVSEGLLDLAEKRKDPALFAAVDRYLGMYFTDTGVAFENPRSQPVRDRVGGIEEPLPWATLARRKPEHPALEIARKFLTSAPVANHAGKKDFTTEGCYTAAYPTAMLARIDQSAELTTIALRQLEARRSANVRDGDIYQRATLGGKAGLRNWCRGTCWYYLGLVRTLQALGDEAAVKEWQPELRRVAEFLQKHQREDGLWGNFIHDPQSIADTSGSAGLATALARAHTAGWLPAEARQAAQRTLAGLKKHLTPDGLLGGAAQSNKGGESLQQGSYRVIYQMGMGLNAQLLAAL